MCGRFVLLTDLSVIVERFGIREIACEYRPDADIAPGRPIAAVVHDSINRLVSFRWGFVPSWAKDPSVGSRLFNARAETIAQKPSFRNAFQKRRCLIPADGFYEWQKLEKGKRPFRFSLQSGRPFGLAGIYETWLPPGGARMDTCAIITTEPNWLIRPIHDRMPVIVPKEGEAAWLDPANRDREGLLAMLRPYPAEEMLMAAVAGSVS